MSNIVEMGKELGQGMIPHNVFVCKEAYKIRPAIEKPTKMKGYTLKEFGEQWVDLLECALEEHWRRTIYGRSLQDMALEKIFELEKENKENKETLEHRDSVLSIMYDLVRCDYIKPKHKLDIIKAVIDDECGNFDDLTEKEKELWNYFWKGGFR